MDTSQFEAKKVALKQTKDGHVLTLAIHPDESPDEILRDFMWMFVFNYNLISILNVFTDIDLQQPGNP